MALPTTNIGTEDNRASLNQTLEDLYNTQRVGGAFDAKNGIVTEQGKRSTNGGVGFGFQEVQYTNRNFLVGEGTGVSDFINDGNGLSMYVKGHSDKKYKG